MTRKLINIYGAARSGSTMVDLMLGNDRKGFSLGEVYHWFYPTRTHHFDIKCGCGEYPCPVWARIKNTGKSRFHQTVLDELDVNFLVDSSKDIPWIIDNNEWARASGRYTALNVVLYKQPVSLYYSYWKRSKQAFTGVARAYRGYGSFMRTGLPFVALNYDELAAAPDAVLKRLCDVLGIEYYDGKTRFWEKTHHHLFGSSGVRRQLAGAGNGIFVEKYSDEFEAMRGHVETTIRVRPEIGAVLSRLREGDITRVSEYPASDNVAVRKGLLYYKNRLNCRLRRYFPARHRDREAAFVRAGRG